MLTLKKVNQVINARFPGIILTRGEGYFYLYSDNKELDIKLNRLFTTSIGVYAINQLSLDQWLMHVERVLNDSERNELEREPVFPPANILGS